MIDTSGLRTWVEISRLRFNANIDALSLFVQKRQGSLAIVLKANAYGHDLSIVGQLAQEHQLIKSFLVGDLQEACQLRLQGITKPMLSLTTLGASVVEAARLRIACAVVDEEQLASISASLVGTHIPLIVHLKVDTGLSRLGFLPKHVVGIVARIMAHPLLQLEGIFTHLSDTEEEDFFSASNQLNLFRQVLDQVFLAGYTIACVHALASGGISLLESRFPVVRVGSSAYGLYKSDLHRRRLQEGDSFVQLKSILTWKTRIIQLKTIEKGTFVGYKKTFCAQRKMVLAIVPIGYFDGYSRLLSNTGWMDVRGKRAPVVGLVSMNLTILDVTDISGVVCGDEAIVMGGGVAPTALELAKLLQTIDREVLTGINPHIPRVLID